MSYPPPGVDQAASPPSRPFYGYARQDRKAEGGITARLVADMFEGCRCQADDLDDLHSGQSRG